MFKSQRPMDNRRSIRYGFTVIELMVTVAIIGMLCAIIVPAVQSARGRARDLECKNNLHQIGVALHSHEQMHRVFPTTSAYQLRLFPFLENRMEVWQCPGDSLHSVAVGGDFSYLLNDGTRFRAHHRDGFAVTPLFFGQSGPRPDARIRDFTDGLSNTAAMSERMLISGYNEGSSEEALRGDPKRFLWYIPTSQDTEDDLARVCKAERTGPYPLRYKTSGTVSGYGYDHILLPNQIGCMNGNPVELPVFGGHLYAAVTASSQHGPYVNVLMADGAVRVVSDSIDLKSWRAIATRAGHEVFTLD